MDEFKNYLELQVNYPKFHGWEQWCKSILMEKLKGIVLKQ